MLEGLLVSELDRAMQTFQEQDEKPHYAALAVATQQEWSINTADGTLAARDHATHRFLDIDLRVGAPELDSTHEIRGMSAWQGDDRGTVRLPLDDDPEYALRQVVWRELDKRYREGAERIVMIRANQVVKVEEESPAADFEPRDEGVVDRQEVPELTFDADKWEQTLRRASSKLDSHPSVHDSRAEFRAVRSEKVFVDTEGTRLVHGSTHIRVSLTVQTTAEDGDVVHVFDAWDAHDEDGLPSHERVLERADEMVARIAALRDAPRGQPWTGPILLKGRASAVFFHEVFGHRVEGHRQKSASEGKTFAEHVGNRLLPDYIDVYDDPTIDAMASTDLNGFYAYDDEGTPAQRAVLIEDGVFQGFLMGRSPIQGFEASNGHGRRMPGRAPVARMGNTIVEASKTVPYEDLRAMLVDEVKAQGLEYGIIVEEIDGGFTMTGRMMPNAFNIRASASWKVFADGRPDELVRGIDLVGTPFAAFGNLVAAADAVEVFNGHCGAESGWVPVSGVAPAMFFKKLEFQLKEKGQERPPLLAKPTASSDGSAEATP